jgi:hypothetical protein
MIRAGEPDVAELMAQLAANAAEIAALKAEKEALSQRVVKLEEELALARLHRFAPRSEKHVDRIFNEAEEAADEDDPEDGDKVVADLPDTGGSVRNFVYGRAVEHFCLCPRSLETIREENSKLGFRHCPFSRRHLPLFLRSVQDQIQEFRCCLIGREMAPCTHCAA